MFGSQSGQPEHELWDLYVLDVFCLTALYPLGSQFYLHSPVLLCLPVCCVWVSDSHLGASGQFCLSDQTHPRCDFHSAKPKQTGSRQRLLDWVSVTTGLFSDSLHCNTFQNMPTALLSLPKPFRLLFGCVNIPSQTYLHISTTPYLQNTKWSVPGTKEELYNDLLVLLRYRLLLTSFEQGTTRKASPHMISGISQHHLHFHAERQSF